MVWIVSGHFRSAADRNNEQTDLWGYYSSYEEHFKHVSHILYANESKYTKADIKGVHFDDNGPPEHILWSSIAPSTEESRAQSMAEGAEQLTELSQQDLRDNESILTSGKKQPYMPDFLIAKKVLFPST